MSSSDLTFYMQVYREPDHGRTTVQEIREHFPGARVVVYCDGGPDQGHRLADLRVEYVRSPSRAFLQGGLAAHLMLGFYLSRPSPHLIKVDPDTVVHRPFASPLPAGCVFGTVQFAEKPDASVQGGCMGFAFDAAEKLFRSRLLLDRRLENVDDTTEDPHLVHLYARRLRTGLGSFDWTVAWACRRLGVPMTNIAEVRSTWQHPCRELPGTYAITHPRHARPTTRQDADAEQLRRLGVLSLQGIGDVEQRS